MGSEKLPRPADELEALANYYDEHDTADEMADGRWVQPMVTTSLRLPRDVFEQLKENARREGKRHTAYIREILEHSLRDGTDSGQLRGIEAKLDALLQAVRPASKPSSGPAKEAGTTRQRAAPTAKNVKRSA